MEEQNKIDQLFRAGLESAEVSPPSRVWNSLEKELVKPRGGVTGGQWKWNLLLFVALVPAAVTLYYVGSDKAHDVTVQNTVPPSVQNADNNSTAFDASSKGSTTTTSNSTASNAVSNNISNVSGASSNTYTSSNVIGNAVKQSLSTAGLPRGNDEVRSNQPTASVNGTVIVTEAKQSPTSQGLRRHSASRNDETAGGLVVKVEKDFTADNGNLEKEEVSMASPSDNSTNHTSSSTVQQKNTQGESTISPSSQSDQTTYGNRVSEPATNPDNSPVAKSTTEVTPTETETAKTDATTSSEPPATIPTAAPETTNVDVTPTELTAAASASAPKDSTTTAEKSAFSRFVKKTVTRLSFSAFGSLDYSKTRLTDNDEADQQTIEDYNNRKTYGTPFTAGVQLNYDISKYFAISGGVSYSRFGESTSNTIIFTVQEDPHFPPKKPKPGGIRPPKPSGGTYKGTEYHFNTSCGRVQIKRPEFGPRLFRRDTTSHTDTIYLHTTTTQNFEFIDLPLSLTFQLMSNRFTYYVQAGVSAKKLIGQEVSINIEDIYTESSNDIEGLNTWSFTALLGLGVRYNLVNHLSVYLQPTLRYGLTPLTKDTNPINSYSNSLGLCGGLYYHF